MYKNLSEFEFGVIASPPPLPVVHPHNVVMGSDVGKINAGCLVMQYNYRVLHLYRDNTFFFVSRKTTDRELKNITIVLSPLRDSYHTCRITVELPQTIHTRVHRTAVLASTVPYGTQNMHVEWKIVTGNPQVMRKLEEFAAKKNVLQHQLVLQTSVMTGHVTC